MATLEALARQYAATNPKRDGHSWSGWCASLMYRFNNASQAYPTAFAAGDAAGVLNPNPAAAPIGAVHYWSGVGGKGHVAQDVGGCGSKLFMASSTLEEVLGGAIGFISFDAYQAKHGLPYRGWSMSYGTNPVLPSDDTGVLPAPPAPPAPAAPPTHPAGTAQLRVVDGDGVQYHEPIKYLAQRIGSALATRNRVNHPFKNDGVPGTNWRMGVQKTLSNAGLYSGTIDGKLGPNNLRGVQEYAKRFGDYKGPLDSDPRANSWRGFALGLERT